MPESGSWPIADLEWRCTGPVKILRPGKFAARFGVDFVQRLAGLDHVAGPCKQQHAGTLASGRTGQLRDLGNAAVVDRHDFRSEEHTSELQSLMRNSYAVFCLKKKNTLQYTR